jgi:hypothetical protein
MAGENFTQPGEQYPSFWHDELMPWIAYREAARLIYGPGYDELMEAQRLLISGDPDQETVVTHLEKAITLAPDAYRIILDAFALLEDHRVGYETLVSTSEGTNAVDWQYRFSEPSDGGETEDSQWMSGLAPFGSDTDLFFPRTTWKHSEPDIWIRTTFELSKPPTGSLVLRVGINDAAEIYINGVLAVNGTWNDGNYEQFAVSAEAAEAIHPGTNVLFVHCHNNDTAENERCAIDVGLYHEDISIRERLLTAGLMASPDSSELLRQRSILNVRRGRWHDAAVDSERALEFAADASSIAWMKVVALHAQAVVAGDNEIADYQRVCNAMIKRFRNSDSLADIERTLKCCPVLNVETDIEELSAERISTAFADGAVSANLTSWFNLAVAMSALRTDEPDRALDLIQHALDTLDGITNENLNANTRSLAETIHGIALVTIGQSDDTKSAIANARELLAGQLVYHTDGSLVGASILNSNGDVLHDLLFVEILLREAEAVLE